MRRFLKHRVHIYLGLILVMNAFVAIDLTWGGYLDPVHARLLVNALCIWFVLVCLELAWTNRPKRPNRTTYRP